MSLRSSLFEAIDVIVDTFVEKISSTYNIDATKLHALWNEVAKQENVTAKKEEPQSTETNDISSGLSKMTKNELVDLCKAKGYKVTGTKSELIERLTSLPKEIVVTERVREKIVTKEPEIVKQLIAHVPTVPIRKNVFGNYEHPETSLIFDDKTKKVIGKQNDDGTVSSITRSDIDMCNKFKFQYEIPLNLNEDKITVSATEGDEEGDEDEENSEFNDDDFLEEEEEDEADYVSDN